MTDDNHPAAIRTPPRAAIIVAVAVAGAAIAIVGYALMSGDTRFTETGDSFPGYLTAAGNTVGYFLAALLGSWCLGGLIYVIVCSRPDRENVIDGQVYRVHRAIERAAAGWAILSAVMVVFAAGYGSGVPVNKVVTAAQPWPIIEASEQSVGWLVTTGCALIVAVASRFLLSWNAHAVLTIPAAGGALAAAVTGSAGQGPQHDYMTSAAIIFAVAVAALVGLLWAAALSAPRDVSDGDLEAANRRVCVVGLGMAIATLLYGLVLGGVLVPGRYVFTTAYGRFGVLTAVCVLLIAVMLAIGLRRPRSRSGIGLLLTSAAVTGTAAMAGIAGVQTRISPALLAHPFTIWDVFLGYTLTKKPTAATISLSWRLDLFLGVLAIAMAVCYAAGVIALRRSGVSWSPWRTLSWLLGCVSLLTVTSSGIRTYGMAMFSVHMVEHMALNMFIPVLLVLGAPVTLALRALPVANDGLPGPREYIVWLVHSRFISFFANPIVALSVFVGSLYGVYFTPLFDTLVRYHWGHELMSVHFLITGYVFYWAIIGLDPGPKRLPFFGRLGLLMAVMPFHAFFGIATMTMTSVLGGTFYRYLSLPWVPNLHDDQFLGGAIAWGTSEIPLVIVILALVFQWARHDRRSGEAADRRVDRYANDELDAYNAMLKELSQGRK